jgi:hypothetical protein
MFEVEYKEPVSGYPTLLLLSGQPGVGKSSLINGLNVNGHKALHLDLQGGTTHVGGYVLDLNAIAIKNNTSLTNAFIRCLDDLRKKNVENGSPLYDFVVLDPLTRLKEIIHTYGTFLYNNSVQGKAAAKKIAIAKFGDKFTAEQLIQCYSKDVVTDLGQNGWSFLNNAWNDIFSKLIGVAGKSTIIIAHSKLNVLKKAALAEVEVRQIDFYPSYLLNLLGESSDSGQVIRKGDKVFINFEFKDDHDHFKSRNFDGLEFCLSTKEGNKITVDWSPIYPFLSPAKDAKPKSK